MTLSDTTTTPASEGDSIVSLARRLDVEGRHAEAVDVLERAARAGDPAAMTRLGLRLLTGLDAPLDRERGLTWVLTAADRDHPDALGRLAVLWGVGALGPPDWNTALDHLRRAATLGSAEARAQLALLASPAAPVVPADLEGSETWADLARRVDIQAWITPPLREPLCEAPRVRMARRFAPPSVCDWIRGRAQGRMRPAMMYDGTCKTAKFDPHRTCSDHQFDILNTDLVLLLVRERVAALTKLPTVAMEPPRIFHYALGEEIKPHFDRCGDPVEGYGEGTGYLGDRIVTFLLYLNEDFEGGDLDFPRAGFRCKGAKGDAVYFAHVGLDGGQDPLSLHAGLKITRGEKWVLSQWIHDRPFGVPEPQITARRDDAAGR